MKDTELLTTKLSPKPAPSPGTPTFGSEAQARRGEGWGEGSPSPRDPLQFEQEPSPLPSPMSTWEREINANGAKLILIVSLLLLGCAKAQTVAYWRFDSGSAGKVVLPEIKIPDVSGNHNDLVTFNQLTAPTFSNVVPFAKVPQTDQFNQLSMDNTQRSGKGMPTRDLFVVHSGDGFDLTKDDLNQWTIEASILFKPVENWKTRWQCFIARDGYNLPNRDAQNEDRLANLGFKKRGDNNHLSIEAWDASGKYVVVQSKEAVVDGQWYHVAATSDGKKLTLFVNGPDDKAYVKQGEVDFNGPLANGGGGWAIGRGCYANWPTEQFFGLIDEVRISASALNENQLLATAVKNPVSPVPATIASKVNTTKPSDPKFPEPSKDLVNAHDPAVVLADGQYHVFATNDGIQHWRSKDLSHWDKLPSVFARTPEWAEKLIGPKPGLWAPDVSHFNGRYHLYYSISHFGQQRSAIALATNTTLDPDAPGYKWEDQGVVIESKPGDDSNAIDPAILIDPQGQVWMSWGSWNKGIYLVKIDPSTGKVDPKDSTYHHLAARPRNDAIEGPGVFFHDGWYYLTTSNDFCCRGEKSTYKLMVGRSRKITGPYLDRENQLMLEGHATLLIRGYDYHRGPGHTSVITQGDRLLLTHHYYDSRANGRPTLGVRPLYFDNEAWPLLGEPIDTLTTKAKSLDGTWRVYEDYGKAARLDFSSNELTGRLGKGKWVVDGTKLKITWPPLGREGRQMIDECFVADDQRSFVGRRTDGTIVCGIRE